MDKYLHTQFLCDCFCGGGGCSQMRITSADFWVQRMWSEEGCAGTAELSSRRCWYTWWSHTHTYIYIYICISISIYSIPYIYIYIFRSDFHMNHSRISISHRSITWVALLCSISLLWTNVNMIEKPYILLFQAQRTLLREPEEPRRTTVYAIRCHHSGLFSGNMKSIQGKLLSLCFDGSQKNQ